MGKLLQNFSLSTNFVIADRQDATYEIELSDRLPDLEWDYFLAHTHGGSHFQTSRWAEVKLELGWQVLRAKVRGCGEVLGGTQILMRRIPLLGSIGFISRGPVISSAHREVLPYLIDTLRKVARQYKIQYLLLQPPCGEGWLVDHLQEKGFLRSIVSVAPTAIVLIDLSPGEEVLLNRMTPRVRRYIRSAVSKGISVQEGKEADIPIFLHLLHVTAAANGWSIHSDSYYHKIWETLYSTDNLRLTIARWAEEDIAALLVYAHGEMVYGKTLVRTGQHNNSGAHELLIWESIKWASSSGYRIYDLSGIDPALGEKYLTGTSTLNQVIGGPAFSKLKFGGEVVLCPQALTYLYNPRVRSAYRLTFQTIQNASFVQQFTRHVRGLRWRMKSKRDIDKKLTLIDPVLMRKTMTERRKSKLRGGKYRYNQLAQKDTDFQIHITSSLEDKNWDDYLAKTSGGSHIQTAKWANVKSQLGWRTWRVLAIDNNKIIGGAQMLLRPLALGLSIGYVPRGPVMMNFQPGLAQQIIDTLKKIAKREKCLILSIQPPQNGQSLSALLHKSHFIPSSLQVAPAATVLIDLAQEPDEILARMKRGTRYNVNLSSRKDIMIEEGGQQELKDFYELLQITCRRQNFKIFPMEYFNKMWDTFDLHGNIKLFLAKYNAQIISAQLAIAFGDTVVSKLTVWSGQYAKLHPNEGLLWGVMQWAKAQGYRYYDLEGIERATAERIMRDEHLPKSMKATVTHFKLGFGGDVVLFPPPHTLTQNPIVGWVYHKFIDRGNIPPAIQSILEHLRTTDNRSGIKE